MEISSSRADSRTHDLLLPDMSGIAELVGDYSLPDVATSIKDIVNEHNKHNENVLDLIRKISSDNEKLASELSVLRNELDRVKIKLRKYRKSNRTTSSKETIVVEVPAQPIELPADDLKDKSEPVPVELPADDLKDKSEFTPIVHYSLIPTFGEDFSDAEGEISVSGDIVKINGKIVVNQPSNSDLTFETPSDSTPVELVKCDISYLDVKIDNLSLEDLSRGAVKIDLSDLDTNSFPVAIQYYIKYRSAPK